MKLTVRNIDAIKPGSQDQLFWDDDVKGFGFKVTPRGKRTFLFHYRTIDRVQRKPKIGDYPTMKPEKARSIAKEWDNIVRTGGDPSSARKARRTSDGKDTLAAFFDEYRKSKSKMKSISEIDRLFKHDILPVLGNRKVSEINRGDVTRLLDAISPRSLSMANAVRRQLSAFYTWALPRLPDDMNNPVKNAAKVEPVPQRSRVLSEPELARLWHVLESEADVWRNALRLLILTGQRRNEVFQATWNEVDLTSATWTISAPRAKNGLAHVVPLNPEAITLLEGLPTRDGRLFPKGTGASSRAAARIRKAMGCDTPHWCWHDIRRTVATGLQRLGVRLEVTEAVLNHISGSRAGMAGVYQLHHWSDEKRAALILWGEEVGRLVAMPQSS